MVKAKPKLDPLVGRRVKLSTDAKTAPGELGAVTSRIEGADAAYRIRLDNDDMIEAALAEFTVLADDLATVTRTVLPALDIPVFTARPEGAGSRARTTHTAVMPWSGAGDDVQMAVLQRTAIVRSRTNPRKRFDTGFVQELAVSIKLHRLAQPILVRPLPASRVQDTAEDRQPGEPMPTHEIVSGEQRWRACGIAGLHFIPCLIRNLTDDQVREIQLVENLKRSDLHPLEEAEGYELLMSENRLTAEAIADRIGKGRSYVYKTITLLKMASEAREALYDGRLSRSTAELVAARPLALQAVVLKEITAPDHRGEGMSYRAAKAHIEDKYMLQLVGAPFDTADATLMTSAGACGACPKRSGANPELFDDVKNADTCTDPTCFASKKTAHYDRIRAAADERGQAVITGKEAREIMPHGQLKGYRKVDESVEVPGGTFRPLRDVLGDDMPMPILVEDPQTKVMIEVLPTAVVGQLLKAQTTPAAASAGSAPTDAEAKRIAQATYERTWRQRAIEALHARITDGTDYGVGPDTLRAASQLILSMLGKAEREHACELLNLGKVATEDALRTHIREAETPDVVLMLLVMEQDMRSCTADTPAPATGIEAVAYDCTFDVKPIVAKVKREMKAAARASTDTAAADSTSPAKIKARPYKPKTTAAEASAAIADAMQHAEESAP